MIYIYESLDKMRDYWIDPQDLFWKQQYMSMIAHAIAWNKIHCKTDEPDSDDRSRRANLIDRLFGEDDTSEDKRRTPSWNDNDTWYNGDWTATHSW